MPLTLGQPESGEEDRGGHSSPLVCQMSGQSFFGSSSGMMMFDGRLAVSGL